MPTLIALRAAWLTVLLLTPAVVAAQVPVTEAPPADRPPWSGSVSAVAQTPGGWVETLEGTLTFAYRDTWGQTDYFDLEGGTLIWAASGSTHNGCSVSGGPFEIYLDPSRDGGSLWVDHGDGSYNGVAHFPYFSVLFDQLVITCPLPQEPVVGPGTLSILFVGSQDPSAPSTLIEDGTRMEGAYEGYTFTGLTAFTWDLTNVPDDVVLVVEIGGYDTWLPEAGPDERTRGNSLTVGARLQKPDGSATTRTASEIAFELIEGTVSQEPGISLNYPLGEAATRDYDLQLNAAHESGYEISEDGLRARRTGADLRQASVEVSAFDFGAYGALRVTAQVGGRRLVGQLLPGRETEILLPKRRPGSYVADYWKAEFGVAHLPDDDDSDGSPEGDGHAGDGLTLYEEYRGFMENQRHLRTDPRVKDLFVFDEVQGRSKRGIALFQGATGLAVHHQLLATEFDPTSRVINANRGEGPHLGDQHGLWLRPGERQYVSEAVGGPGLPRKVERIELSVLNQTGPEIWAHYASGEQSISAEYGAHVIAHELGHAVNVWHHGERDRQDVSWVVERDPGGGYARDADGNPVVREYVGGQEWGPVEIRREDGVRYTPRWLLDPGRRDNLWLGLPHGQHSGDEGCIMRYFNGFVYPQTTTGNVRYVIRFTDTPGEGYGEVPGHGLCTSPVGTGVNAPGRAPQPRYGNADQSAAEGPPGRGGCLQRICVNDRHPDH